VALAFAHYAAAADSSCHAEVAHDILEALRLHAVCNDELRGFKSRLPPSPKHYRATEHNIDMFALARLLGKDEALREASTFVQGMYGRNADFPQSYSMGTGGQHACDSSQPPQAPVPADSLYWNLLAEVDPEPGRMAAALTFALETPAPEAKGAAAGQGLWTKDDDIFAHQQDLQGTRFSTAGHGVQWENTASATMAMLHWLHHHGGRGPGEPGTVLGRVKEARRSLLQLLRHYEGVPGSVRGGNEKAWSQGCQDLSATQTQLPWEKGLSCEAKYPGGSDTGLGWTYLRYPHVASTAWTGLLLLYQFSDGEPVREDANPFAPPNTPIPSPKGRSCTSSFLRPGSSKSRHRAGHAGHAGSSGVDHGNPGGQHNSDVRLI